MQNLNMDHFIGIPTRKELSGQLNQPIKMNSAELCVRTIRIFWHSTMHSVDGRWGNYDQEMKPSIESCSKVKECHRVLPRTIYLRTKLLNKDGIQAWVLIWPWWILTNTNWLFLSMVYIIDYAIPTALRPIVDVHEWGTLVNIRIDDMDADENRLMKPVSNPGE